MQVKHSVSQDGIGVETIVDAALDIIVRQGLSELTLRPLALKIGMSVSVISARMGSKDQLIDRVIEEAAARDARFFARWLDLAAAVPTGPRGRATLSDLAFRDWLDTGRSQALFLIELVHDRALQATPSPLLDAWLERAGAFWSTLLFGSPALGDLALGYILDEAGFALGAGGNPAYTLLRLHCLHRFADGLFPGPVEDDAANAIPRLIAALESRDQPTSDLDDPKRRRIADSAAQVIVSQGIDMVTHRSVALAAGVPASTVVYHFGARGALVVAGLNAVILRFHAYRDRARAANVAPNDDSSARDLIKATSMIALASVREPTLVPHALDMRRRRGENIRAVDLESLGIVDPPGFDRATAQVISIALFGMQMIAMARKLPERDYYHRAFAALSAWRTTLAD